MWCKLGGSNSRLQVSAEPCFEDQPPATVSSCRIFKLISRRWRILYLQLIHTKGQPTSIVSSLSIVYIFYYVRLQQIYMCKCFILRISRLSASKSSPVKRPLLRCPVLGTFAPTPLLATLCLLSLSAPGLQGPRQGFFTAGHVANAPEFLEVPLKSP